MKILKVKLTSSECWDIMTTAIESGSIFYWCGASYERFPKNHPTDALSIWSIDIYEFDEDENTPKKPTHHISQKEISDSVNKIIANPKDYPSTVQMILDEDIDSEGADVIVQVACFGKLVYG